MCSSHEDGGLRLLLILLPVEMGRILLRADFYMCISTFIISITAKAIFYLYGFVADMLK